MARNVSQFPLEVLGSVNLTSISTATKITDIPAGTTVIRISAVTEDARITYDGTTPSATVGHFLQASGLDTEIALTDFTKIQVIEASPSGSVFITFFRPKPTG